MHTYTAQLNWERGAQDFSDNRYSRAHSWSFDGGARVHASSSPLSVPLPMSDASAIDPEEALVAALASCHMLFFLSLAAARGLVVDSYADKAVGIMDKDAEGRMAITRIELDPSIVFAGTPPAPALVDQLHHAAHQRCYIANSLKAEVHIACTK